MYTYVFLQNAFSKILQLENKMLNILWSVFFFIVIVILFFET